MTSETINQVIHRMKNMREYIVNVDIPEGFQLNGVMPFDANINGSKGRFKIYAVSKEEAEQRINEYLEKQQQ